MSISKVTEFLIQTKSKLLQLLFNPIFQSFMVFILIEASIYLLLKKDSVNKEMVATCLSGIVIIYGYFLSHFLETYRKIREKKQEQYLALMSSLRMFLNEKGYDAQDLIKQREKFQDSYFESALLISSSGHKKLNTFIEEYAKLITNPGLGNAELIEAQNIFINSLRNEFLPFDPIDFKTTKFDLKP